MKICSCLCVCNSLFNMTNDQIMKTFSTISDLSAEMIIIEKEDNLYICCRDSIFCYDMFDNNNFITRATIFDPVSCFDLLIYGFNDTCVTCIESLSYTYFFNDLVEIKN